MKKMIFLGLGFIPPSSCIIPEKGDECFVSRDTDKKDSRVFYHVKGYEKDTNGAEQVFIYSLFAEPKEEVSFKEIAAKGLEHVEKERSPHRKTVTDPAKERVFSLTEDF